MLTPSEIQDKEFVKAVFGGYDMESVDNFLEKTAEDYGALLRENAVLKSKIKVLVEKLEEYRSTEESMRMALLTAQKMGNEVVEEAKKKGEAILAEVNDLAKKRIAELKQQLGLEEERLEQARRQTSGFSQKVLHLLANQVDFIEGLTELAAPAELKRVVRAGAAQAAAPPEGPAEAPEAPQEPDGIEQQLDREEENLIRQAAALAEKASEPAPEAAEGKKAPELDETAEIARHISDSLGDSTQFSPLPEVNWDDEDEPTTKRPKFEFDDLKFGTNFIEE